PTASLLVSARLGIDDSPSLLHLWRVRVILPLPGILLPGIFLSGSLPISSWPSGASPAIPAARLVVVKLRSLFRVGARSYAGGANGVPESDPASDHSGSPADRVPILGVLPSFCAVGWPVQSRRGVSVGVGSQLPRERTHRCALERGSEGRTECDHVLGRAVEVV